MSSIHRHYDVRAVVEWYAEVRGSEAAAAGADHLDPGPVGRVPTQPGRNPAAPLAPVDHDGQVLELRPNCECCDTDLPPTAPDAMICTFECTFCRDCVESTLGGVCPNCGGGFAPRPIRPPDALRRHPASTVRVVAEGCAPG